MSTIGEFFKKLKIGQKSPEQLEREQDPVLDKQFKRQIPTPEDWRISREYRARKAREKAEAARKAAMTGVGGTPGSVGPRPDYNPNVQYIDQQPIPERQMGQWTTATTPVPQDQEFGGYGRGLLSSSVSDIVNDELNKVRSEQVNVLDLRDRRKQTTDINRPSDNVDSFFKMYMMPDGASDAGVLANVGDDGSFTQEDATKFGYTTQQANQRSSGYDLLRGLLDIKGRATAETPEQIERANAAQAVKDEILEKQFIANELVQAGVIDRRQINNPANQEKINSVYQARKMITPEFLEESRLETERLSRRFPRDRMNIVPENRQYTDAEGRFITENLPDPFGGTTEGLLFNQAPSRYMDDFEESVARQRVQEADRLRARGGEAADRLRLKQYDERDAQKELMDLGEAMGIDATELPAEVVTPPAIEKVVEEPVSYDPFGNVITTSQAKVLDEPVIVKAVDTMNMNVDEWEAYKQGIADIESSGGKYTLTNGQHWGKYQMNNDARADAAKTMGIKNPSKKEFLENPELQERMFAEYTRRNYLHLMQKSPEFQAMSKRERHLTLARAQLGAEALRKTLAGLTPDKIDANKTKSSKFKDSVEKRFRDLSDDRGSFEGTGEF